VKELKKKKKE